GEGRRGIETPKFEVERTGGVLVGEGRCGGRADVLEITQGAVEHSDDSVEVAVAVEVGEGRRAVEPFEDGPVDIVEVVERIGSAGYLGEGWRNRRAGVAEIVQVAVG